ncbi:MAG: phenylalanine 4-monooxygenase [Bacteroidetes bacterium]|jgi:phenylalanine-4-hydroxylase|nr:phenylalanine 4-monooxygenase [Bacteroidota bacterium]|tara:strand:- start:648 stop:2366 length:1719 start_codon:yes stop_codon:yes gene_type:complete
MSVNVIIDRLPKHLVPFIIDQDYSRYTAQDQAVWRAVMKQNILFLKNIAHSSYLDGLKKTGISLDSIPSIEEMNRSLEKIGWAAVTVDGFIPPSAFMEFQKHKILVIAADIRSANHIEYTPAPDIIHEAAGHAPIIADPEYAEYLRYFGEIGSKAFSSKSDYRIYEAIRHLSILKADPTSKNSAIKKAEQLLTKKIENAEIPSEMSLIRNLHWWTVEYGLIGNIKDPKIYGAGLLSSIGESKGALKNSVSKIPYSIDAKDYSFDITAPQPQLFVTPDFKHLTNVLDEFANQMALRTGGLDGVLKAIESDAPATLVYSSGLQISGTFTNVIIHKSSPIYINTAGPTTLNYDDKILDGEGPEKHNHGFGSPIGKIKGTLVPTRFLSDDALSNLGIQNGILSSFEFESGIKVKGELQSVVRRNGKLILMSFINCTVKHKNKILFDPNWGQYDMAVGENIVSAFSGPADSDAFGTTYDPPREKTHQIVYDDLTLNLHKLYEKVREIREKRKNLNDLPHIWNQLIKNYPDEWLLPIEIYELSKSDNNLTGLSKDAKNFLKNKLSIPGSSSIISNILQ